MQRMEAWEFGYKMKKCTICIISFALAIILLATSLVSCSSYNTPPDISDVHEKFENYYIDIQEIVTYMIDTGYKNVYITDADGTVFADLVKMQINNIEVSDAVNHILNDGKYIQIIKNGNTISFLQWTGIQDIECGIAYTINNYPEIEFMIELVPISEDGWFYYVADYNRWRAGERVTVVELNKNKLI